MKYIKLLAKRGDLYIYLYKGTHIFKAKYTDDDFTCTYRTSIINAKECKEYLNEEEVKPLIKEVVDYHNDLLLRSCSE